MGCAQVLGLSRLRSGRACVLGGFPEVLPVAVERLGKAAAALPASRVVGWRTVSRSPPTKGYGRPVTPWAWPRDWARPPVGDLGAELGQEPLRLGERGEVAGVVDQRQPLVGASLFEVLLGQRCQGDHIALALEQEERGPPSDCPAAGRVIGHQFVERLRGGPLESCEQGGQIPKAVDGRGQGQREQQLAVQVGGGQVGLIAQAMLAFQACRSHWIGSGPMRSRAAMPLVLPAASSRCRVSWYLSVSLRAMSTYRSVTTRACTRSGRCLAGAGRSGCPSTRPGRSPCRCPGAGTGTRRRRPGGRRSSGRCRPYRCGVAVEEVIAWRPLVAFPSSPPSRRSLPPAVPTVPVVLKAASKQVLSPNSLSFPHSR
jgi:hypothetical protein